jgi:hypothetical protein
LPLRPSATRSIAPDASESVAIKALSFLATDAELLSRFLALSGLEPANLRRAAARPGFLAGVMAFIAGDEHTLLKFASASGLAPESVAAACRKLNPDAFDTGFV